MLASIIIPAFNRLAPLAQTLASARATCRHLGAPAEILLVDDGSSPPLATALPELAADPLVRLLRQSNQGSIVARQTGLAAARGEFVLFLDSDDLVTADKLHRHCAALRAAPLLVATYDDVGAAADPADPASPIRTAQTFGPAADLPDLVLRVQPPPHGGVFRRDFLLRALAAPVVPPTRSLDSVGDVWLYYNLSVHPGAVGKIDAPLSLVGIHDEGRYSQSWERLGCAALRLAELFMAATAATTAAPVLRARLLVGECAFNSWRRLPRDFSPAYRRRQLAVWRQAPRGPLHRLGVRGFRAVARILGPETAGRLLRLRNAPYAACRTVDAATLARLLAS
jgi:hypothetical protein